MVGERVVGERESRYCLLFLEPSKPALDLLDLKLMMREQSQIKYLISTGKSQWDMTERYIDGL